MTVRESFWKEKREMEKNLCINNLFQAHRVAVCGLTIRNHQTKTSRQSLYNGPWQIDGGETLFYSPYSTFFTARNWSWNIPESLSIAYSSHSQAGCYCPEPVCKYRLPCSLTPLVYALSLIFSILCMQQKPLICLGDDKPICPQTGNSKPRLSKPWVDSGPRGLPSLPPWLLNIFSSACSWEHHGLIISLSES